METTDTRTIHTRLLAAGYTHRATSLNGDGRHAIIRKADGVTVGDYHADEAVAFLQRIGGLTPCP